jgi:hypothetical protein
LTVKGLSDARDGATWALSSLPTRARLLAGLWIVWTGVLVSWMWHNVRDDVFIHLLYAENLVEHGYLTYDGSTPSQGSSSLLYVLALAALSAIRRSIEWPKLVAVAGYAVVAGWTWRARRSLGAWVFVCAALLATPMAVRVLTDGMETSWSIVVAVALAHCAAAAPSSRPSTILRLIVLGAVAALLRMDLVVLVVAIVAADLVRGRKLSTGAWLAVGVAAGVALTTALAGHVISDGAVAKHASWSGAGRRLAVAAAAHGANLSFGLGLPLATGASWWCSSRAVTDRSRRWAAACVTLAGPLFWIAVVASNRVVYGVRYAIPTCVFAFVFNVASMPEARGALEPSPSWPRRARVGIVVVAALWIAEAALLRPVIGAQRRTLEALRGGHLERLAGRVGVAFEAGAIGYFTRGLMCDPNGLVDGRRTAELPLRARIAVCRDRGTTFSFLDAAQQRAFPEVARWPACGSYEIANLLRTDVYHLRVRPDVGCGP